MSGFYPKDWDVTRDILTLEYTDAAPVTPPAIPAALRRVAALDPEKAVMTRTIDMAGGRINGRSFHQKRVDETAALNTIEVWEILNPNPVDHSFHMHGFSFQVLDESGTPIPAWEDTVNLAKYGSVQIIVEFKDYPGKRMFHCHTSSHEDFGLMGILEVR